MGLLWRRINMGKKTCLLHQHQLQILGPRTCCLMMLKGSDRDVLFMQATDNMHVSENMKKNLL